MACKGGEGPNGRLGALRRVGGSHRQLATTGECSASAMQSLYTAKPAYICVINIRLEWDCGQRVATTSPCSPFNMNFSPHSSLNMKDKCSAMSLVGTHTCSASALLQTSLIPRRGSSGLPYRTVPREPQLWRGPSDRSQPLQRKAKYCPPRVPPPPNLLLWQYCSVGGPFLQPFALAAFGV